MGNLVLICAVASLDHLCCIQCITRCCLASNLGIFFLLPCATCQPPHGATSSAVSLMQIRQACVRLFGPGVGVRIWHALLQLVPPPSWSDPGLPSPCPKMCLHTTLSNFLRQPVFASTNSLCPELDLAQGDRHVTLHQCAWLKSNHKCVLQHTCDALGPAQGTCTPFGLGSKIVTVLSGKQYTGKSFCTYSTSQCIRSYCSSLSLCIVHFCVSVWIVLNINNQDGKVPIWISIPRIHG